MPISEAINNKQDSSPPSRSDKGLSTAQARAQFAVDGPNELAIEQRRTLWAIAAEVVREPMFLLLIGAGCIYLAMGDAGEALVLLGFIGIIMGVTVLQERRTEYALEALRDLSSPRALAVRDGAPVRIPGREVVRGDILLLSEGDRVPADGVMLQTQELATDESMLTGESETVAKFGNAATPDRLFAGTLVVRGQGAMLVDATGRHTEFGKIGRSLQEIELESSPMREEVERLTKRLAVLGIVFCLVLSVLFWALRGSALEAMLAGITLAMGILPQEFPVIMIVFLAFGARRIARHQVLTRHLWAIETLGQTTVLCVDKTGTLTQNRMAVSMLSVNGAALDVSGLARDALPEAYHEILEYLVLASEIEPYDPMEQAFHRFAGEYLADTEHLHPDWTLVREYELSPAQLAMSNLWRGSGAQHDVVATKGAPEAIADLCHLDAVAAAALGAEAARLGERGLRVLAVAKSKHQIGNAWPEIQHDFEFTLLGLVGLADPLRPEVPAAIAECRRAGIRVAMITGDHPRTARAIAAQAGLSSEDILTGVELAHIPPAERSERLAHVDVFARVTPQQKLEIVEALKQRGEVVAMTGDGVNDAPALKAAHIGIAMGKRGTDVAREAAALVLLQDDFGAIVAAIRLGRRIYANLRQALLYTFAVHIPIIGLSLLPVLFGLPLLLAPVHIAFLELVIDPTCSVVFEAEEGRADLMQRPPRKGSEALIAWPQMLLALMLGGLTTLMTMAWYVHLLDSGHSVELARTLAFVALVAANAMLILPIRKPRMRWSDLLKGMTRIALIVFAGTLAALALVTWIPAFAQAFSFAVPRFDAWLLALGIGLAMVVAFQLSGQLVAKLAPYWQAQGRHVSS